jgi:hypothetical protein
MNRQRATRTDSRATRQFLVHIDIDLIRRVKISAINQNVTASKIVQEALISYLSDLSADVATAVAGAPGDVP